MRRALARVQGRPLPLVTVLVLTYNRPVEVRKTLAALRKGLLYAGPLALHIADDGSPGPYVRDLAQEERASRFWRQVTHTVTPRKGWGCNANAGLAACGRYVYQTEDDYVLCRPLDLSLGVFLLQEEERIGLVRYRGIAGHRVAANLRELRAPYLPGQGRGLLGRVSYWELRADSPELYVYSHGPHLKDVPRFHGTYGWYPEGLPLGATEETFAHTVKDGSYPVRIAVFPEWVPMWYDHIGTSRQHTDADPCGKR